VNLLFNSLDLELSAMVTRLEHSTTSKLQSTISLLFSCFSRRELLAGS
jgi:hypothetical protein